MNNTEKRRKMSTKMSQILRTHEKLQQKRFKRRQKLVSASYAVFTY